LAVISTALLRHVYHAGVVTGDGLLRPALGDLFLLLHLLRAVNHGLNLLFALADSVPHPLCQLVKGAVAPVLGLAGLLVSRQGKIGDPFA
jgi:hypothetical protein